MFLGVDGGGTKTALCLLDGEGQVVAQARAGGIYYLSEGIELVARVLHDGVAEICAQAGISPEDIHYAFFGLPTYGEVSGDVAALDATPHAALGHDRYACENDMVCAWAGSLGAADGINVISGTGSMTYGQRDDRRVRVGGWGELFGDEGSAYWIAIRGLNAVSRMSDGRLPAGALIDTIRQHLGLAADLDLVDVVLNRWQGSRAEIAALSRQVVDAADLGDACAASILADAGRELALLVDTTRHRLDYPPGEATAVSYSGGTFSAARVLRAFRREVAVLNHGYRVHSPLYPPVIGAAVYAARLAGTPLQEAALERLRSVSRPTLR